MIKIEKPEIFIFQFPYTVVPDFISYKEEIRSQVVEIVVIIKSTDNNDREIEFYNHLSDMGYLNFAFGINEKQFLEDYDDTSNLESLLQDFIIGNLESCNFDWSSDIEELELEKKFANK